MLAFHGKQKIKDKYLARLAAHQAADEIIKGRYWENGKGCAIGCTIHDSNHHRYETELGIPRMLARLEDCIFEGLPNDKAKEFPIQFLNAIQPGADLSKVGIRFMLSIQRRNLKRLDQNAHPDVAAAIKECMAVLCDWLHGNLDKNALRAPESAAKAMAVGIAALAAAYIPESKAALSACFACNAAEAAAKEGNTTVGAAKAMAWAGETAWSAPAWREGRAAKYVWMARKLISLLREASNAKTA